MTIRPLIGFFSTSWPSLPTLWRRSLTALTPNRLKRTRSKRRAFARTGLPLRVLHLGFARPLAQNPTVSRNFSDALDCDREVSESEDRMAEQRGTCTLALLSPAIHRSESEPPNLATEIEARRASSEPRTRRLRFGLTRPQPPKPREIACFSRTICGWMRKVSAVADSMAVEGVGGQLLSRRWSKSGGN